MTALSAAKNDAVARMVYCNFCALQQGTRGLLEQSSRADNVHESCRTPSEYRTGKSEEKPKTAPPITTTAAPATPIDKYLVAIVLAQQPCTTVSAAPTSDRSVSKVDPAGSRSSATGWPLPNSNSHHLSCRLLTALPRRGGLVRDPQVGLPRDQRPEPWRSTPRERSSFETTCARCDGGVAWKRHLPPGSAHRPIRLEIPDLRIRVEPMARPAPRPLRAPEPQRSPPARRGRGACGRLTPPC